MGLKCSLLGHSFEPADVEREREEQGSEVVTTVRELERCHRCGKERVVSESTEVTAVVDAEEVAVSGGDSPGVTDDVGVEDAPAADPPTAGTGETAEGGGLDGMIDRSEAADDDHAPAGSAGGDTVADAVGDGTDATGPEDHKTGPENRETDLEDRDPDSEDAEILTDDDRASGEWPEEAYDEGYDGDGVEPAVEHISDEGELSGITVPDGWIVCPECDFGIEAQSGYRGGDPCPECGEWLASERNR